jgi:uncharacterized SAM-binding protein YcdF (DUF218 family)
LLVILAYGFRAPLLTGLAGFLVVDDKLSTDSTLSVSRVPSTDNGPQPADLIFVLNGEIETRPFHAVDLFKQGLAPQILIARVEDSPPIEMGLWPNETDVAIKVMRELNVPTSHITVLTPPGGVSSTYEEAVSLRQYVEKHNIQRIILTTSAFHTRRARWIFRKVLADSGVDFTVSAAPHLAFDKTNWWTIEEGLVYFMNEYIKLLYYLIVY